MSWSWGWFLFHQSGLRWAFWHRMLSTANFATWIPQNTHTWYCCCWWEKSHQNLGCRKKPSTGFITYLNCLLHSWIFEISLEVAKYSGGNATFTGFWATPGVFASLNFILTPKYILRIENRTIYRSLLLTPIFPRRPKRHVLKSPHPQDPRDIRR